MRSDGGGVHSFNTQGYGGGRLEDPVPMKGTGCCTSVFRTKQQLLHPDCGHMVTDVFGDLDENVVCSDLVAKACRTYYVRPAGR